MKPKWRVNNSSWIEIFAQILTNDSLENIGFSSEKEAARYDADPDKWAAEHFNMTLREYYEWIKNNPHLRDEIAA